MKVVASATCALLRPFKPLNVSKSWRMKSRSWSHQQWDLWPCHSSGCADSLISRRARRWDPRLCMMGCVAWFCCKRGGGVDQRPKAGFEFLLVCEQSPGSMRFQLHSGLFPVGFQLFSSHLTTCQKYWSCSWRRRGPVELEQILMHMQVFYFQGRYSRIRCPGEPLMLMLVQ